MENEKLIDLCTQGDEQALGLLYKTYADKMMRICLRYVSDEQTAQDLLHDGFLIIFSSLHTLRSPEKLEKWMERIMKNVSLQYLKTSRPASIALDAIAEAEEPAESMPSTGLPTYEQLIKTIERLPEGYRNVFKLAVLEGLSHKEIASLLHIAPHSSSSQLSRAKEMLRKLLSRYTFVIGLALSFIASICILLYNKKEKDLTEYKKPETKNSKPVPTQTEHLSLSVPRPVPTPYTRLDETNAISIFPDSISNKKDSMQTDTTTHFIIHSHRMLETPYAHTSLSDKHKKKRAFSFAYSGERKQTTNRLYQAPGDISSGESQQVKETVHHSMPVTFALTLRNYFNSAWGIETGLQYTYLRSDFTQITDLHTERIQKVNYIGIPLKGILNLWHHSRFSAYASAGITLDIPIKATSEETIKEEGRILSHKKTILHPSLQWSTQLGIGIQYQLTPAISIYAEPNLNYYFKNDLNTIRKEQPFTLTLPIGIRYSW